MNFSISPEVTSSFVHVFSLLVSSSKTWLKYALILIVGGTLGNFIDRLISNGVVDFLSFNFWGYAFPVFNFADTFLTVGVIMLIFYYCFLDDNAIFKKNTNQKVDEQDGGEVANEDFSDNGK